MPSIQMWWSRIYVCGVAAVIVLMAGLSRSFSAEGSSELSGAQPQAAASSTPESTTLSDLQHSEAQRLGVAPIIQSAIGMRLVLIPRGEFIMGSRKSGRDLAIMFGGSNLSPDWFRSEFPAHRVRISRAFYLGESELTIGQFRRFVDEFKYTTERESRSDSATSPTWRTCPPNGTDDHPVAMLSWNDVAAFCQWLQKKENRVVRLPTEAEWEYACRAGSEGVFCCGDSDQRLSSYAWFDSSSGVYPERVRQKRPNAWGLYDMHGNVWEWCQDWYSNEYYGRSPVDDPPGPSSGRSRIIRGGSYCEPSYNLRCSNRNWLAPAEATYTGARIVMECGKEPEHENTGGIH